MSRKELSAEAALVAQLKERLGETQRAVKEERTLADRLRAEAKTSSDSLSRKVRRFYLCCGPARTCNVATGFHTMLLQP